MKPGFIGLGAQKAGTTWLSSCLYDHPQVYMPFSQIHFFSRDPLYRKGIDWYERHFEGCPHGKLTGEFSASYLHSESAPERIYRYHPNAKIMVCLRNPLDRALSDYRNDIMGGALKATTPFDDALEHHQEYLTRGLYHQQLQRYLSFFPPAQVLVLLYDDAFHDRLGFVRRMYKFLGIDQKFSPGMLNSKVNVGRVPRSVPIDRALTSVAEILRAKRMHRFLWLLRKWGIITLVRQINTQRIGSSEISPEVRRDLRQFFSSDIGLLEHFLDRDLSMWMQDS